MAIPDDLIPSPVLGMVRDAEKYSLDLWREIVLEWSDVTIKFAIAARMRTEAGRIETLKARGHMLGELAATCGEDDAAGLTCVALQCLSTQALARLFQALDIESRLNDLSVANRQMLSSNVEMGL